MKYQAIIFDVGDTLVNYWPNYAWIYTQRLRSLGFAVEGEFPSVISKAIYRAGGEQTRREQAGAPRMEDREFQRMLDTAALACITSSQNIAGMLDELERMEIPRQEMRVIEGVFPMLDALKQRGYRLAIVSNHYAALLDFLRERQLASYFDPIIISAIVGVEKPNVRIMELALEGLRLPAEKCLYVGDHPLDVLCAKSAGMDVAWIASAEEKLPEDIPFREDYRVEAVADVVGLL